MTDWKPMVDAPRDDGHGRPQPILLYLPGAHTKADGNGVPIEVEHARVVGWWDAAQEAWVVGLHHKKHSHKVYPSCWTELPDAPPHA